MKVLMIGWELPPHNSGGLGIACLGLTRALARKGADITFVLPKSCEVNCDFMKIIFADIEEDSELFANSYTTLASGILTKQIKDQLPPGYVRCALAYAEKMKNIAKKVGADVVHTHDWMTFKAGIVAKEILGKPLIAHIHNTVFDRGAGQGNPYEYAIEKEGFEKADRIVSVSDFTKNTLIERYGIDPGKIDTVHNGVEEIEKQNLPPTLTALKDLGYKVVLSLGRITIQKGVDYLISAAKKVLDINPKVIFVIVGSGDMQGQVMSQAAELGIMNNVIFTGFLRGRDLIDRMYQTADLFVMPSVSEPFGIVPLEAVANGTPVLVSKQSGVSEVLDHALKVDFWDTDEMANKILAVLENPALGTDLKKESGKELAGITWDKAAGKCMAVYRQLI